MKNRDLVSRTECNSGKLGFRCRRKAKHRAKLEGRRHEKRFEIYRCHLCGHWHLATYRPGRKRSRSKPVSPFPADFLQELRTDSKERQRRLKNKTSRRTKRRLSGSPIFPDLDF